MNYNYLLKDHLPDKEKLLACGFVERDGKLVCKRDLYNGLYAEIVVAGNTLEADVYDSMFNEKYLPFSSGHGGGAIKSQVRDLLDEILSRCCTNVDATGDIVDYIFNKFGVAAEHPWEESPVDMTFKTKLKNKWFAIIMQVKPQSMGLVGDKNLSVMNVKLEPSRVQELTDGVHYFPAYHMNKVHWLSVLLDSGADLVQVKQLVDDSYSLTEWGRATSRSGD